MNIDELLDVMDETLEEAVNLPFTGGKRMVDVEKVRDIIDDIRLNMPAEIRQAKAIVQDRADIVESAKKEAEAIVKRAEDRARAMVAQEAIVKAAQQKATEILTSAQSQSREMRTTVTNYCENMLRHTEEQLAKSMTEVKTVRSTLRQSGKKLRYVPPPSLRSPNNALCSARLLETFRGGRFLFDAPWGTAEKEDAFVHIRNCRADAASDGTGARAGAGRLRTRSVGERGMVVQRAEL